MQMLQDMPYMHVVYISISPLKYCGRPRRRRTLSSGGSCGVGDVCCIRHGARMHICQTMCLASVAGEVLAAVQPWHVQPPFTPELSGFWVPSAEIELVTCDDSIAACTYVLAGGVAFVLLPFKCRLPCVT